MQKEKPEGAQSITPAAIPPAAQEVGKVPNPRFHGSEPIRGLEGLARSVLEVGRFGRIFRNLTPFEPKDDDLEALGDTMFEPEPDGDQDENPAGDNHDIPAGFTYFGQFIDHDLTFDPNSKLQRQNDPNALVDFRTPRFDLDSLYGAGPDDDPYLYEAGGIRLLLETNETGDDDLPRNSRGRALIGDPRNDENLIVSGLHSAFIRFHNKVVDKLGEEGFPMDQLFDEARQVVRWHYQWIVIHDFLKTVVGHAVVDDILKFEKYVVLTEGNPHTAVVPKIDLKFYHWANEPFMPVEFSVASYRFGHSMVRPDYDLNETIQQVPIFSDKVPDLRGFRKRPAHSQIDWARFFKFPEHLDPQNGFPQPTRNIDTKLAFGLGILPEPVINLSPEDKKDPKRATEFAKLAVRNLLRGKALGLPTGQDVARTMGIPAKFILTGDRIAKGDGAITSDLSDDLKTKFADTTPLWYYILKEAEVLNKGKKLGPVGGRIVAEVFIGLLHGDPLSYLRVEPTWRPTRGKFGAADDGHFTIADFLRFATTP